MSWTCPHQMKDSYCQLRNEECKPGSEGCVLSKRFRFIRAETNLEFEEDEETQKKQKT